MADGVESYMPMLAMVCLQSSYAAVALVTRLALVQGLSPLVYVVYRHGIAALIMATVAYLSRRKDPNRISTGLKGFGWIFLASLGVAANQIFYYEGLYYASSIAAGSMANVSPVLTFVLSTIFGLERVEIRKLTSIAKIVGTAICISGAVCMTLIKGPTLLNAQSPPLLLPGGGDGDNWLLGCLFLLGNSLFWTSRTILQVPINAHCPDKLYSSTWLATLVTLDSAVVVLFIERDVGAWKLNSLLEVGCSFLGGLAVVQTFTSLAWCISKRGPLFAAIFNPLSTVIITVLAAIFLREKLYLGSLIGAIAVITGLYIVLWGKAKDVKEHKKEMIPKSVDEISNSKKKEVIRDGNLEKDTCEVEFEQPLLSNPLNFDKS